MWDLLLLVSGFLPLLLGATLLVDGASSAAKRLGISNLVIGLTVVAFGTSTPELVVNVFASLGGDSGIVLGNIIGSNIFNILAILGLSALIYPLRVKNRTTWIEVPLCLLSSLVVFVMASDKLIDHAGSSTIARGEGIVLLFFFMVFIAYTVSEAKQGVALEEVAIKTRSMPVSIAYVVSGLILLVAGGRMIVVGASEVARQLLVPERIIGLTIVSIGTSLPELATSAVAAWKKNVDIAIGNIVGSNLFNVFFVLGISAVIAPVSVQRESIPDFAVNIGASMALFLFIFTGRGRQIDRWEGTAFLFLYVLYVLFLVFM